MTKLVSDLLNVSRVENGGLKISPEPISLKDLIEEVKLIDEYEDDEKFGKDKKSYTFRIIYRSIERTLTNEEINKIQDEIREKTRKDLNADIR